MLQIQTDISIRNCLQWYQKLISHLRLLEFVHICTLEPDQLLQIQTRNAIRRLMYVNSSCLQSHQKSVSCFHQFSPTLRRSRPRAHRSAHRSAHVAPAVSFRQLPEHLRETTKHSFCILLVSSHSGTYCVTARFC